jgi:hypothetical protein
MGKGIEFLIEFKMQKGVATELRDIYAMHLTSYGYTDPHEQLLAEHIKDLYLRLEHMVNTMLKTAKLRMNNSEALAFFQLWNTIDTSRWPLANVILNDMILKIDKRVKEPRRYGR